jgi:2Fe-2S ferredoxin
VKTNKQPNSATKKPSSIKFLNFNKNCAYEGFQSILEVALAHEIKLNHSCGGMGSCTTCRVFIQKGADKLEPRNELEQEHAQMRGFKQNERLGCQTLAKNGLEVLIPDEHDEIK